jgi:hypothetical protein
MKPLKSRERVPVREKVSRRADEREHNRILDVFVVTLCLLLAMFFFYRFWGDMNQRMVKAGEQPVGTITFKKKAAQRRFVDRVLWDRLQRESPVYNGDVIRTADISEASITFNLGGQMINLSENSLIQIFDDENGLRVDFSEGDISVESAQGGVALLSGGKTVNIDAGGVVSARTHENGAINLVVASGNAQLVNEDGTVETAVAGSGLFYNEDGSIDTGPRALVYAPKPDSKMLVTENAPAMVEFLWNSMNYISGMFTRLEFASDRNFRNITYAENFTGTERTAQRIPAGTLYWRTFPVSQSGQRFLENATTGKISVLYAPPPALVSPLPNDTFTYRNILPVIHYQWSGSGTDDQASFWLVVADNPAMVSPVAMANVRGNTQFMEAPGTGTWYWRVEPVFSQETAGVPAASEVSSFTIEHVSSDIPMPALMLPSPNSILSVAENGPDSHFSWKSDTEAVSFNIIISRNANLSSPIISAPVANSYYVYSARSALLQTGTYYWGATQTDAAGIVSPLSEVRPFKTSLFAEDARTFPAPVIVSPAENSRIALSTTPVEFRWRAVSGADRYSFRLYRTDRESVPVYETDTPGTLSVSVPVTPGNYVWTVQATGRTRSESAEWAGNIAEQRFMARNVASVNPVSPTYGSTIAGLDAARSGVLANWTTSEPLRSSRFILSANPDPLQGIPIMDVPNPTAPLALPNLSAGTYYWTVLAETDDYYTASTRTPARFQVSAVTVAPIALVSPANGTEIPMPEINRSGVVRWTSTETPARSRFVLSRNPNPLSGTPVLDIQNPSQTVMLPALEPGVYYWTVTGTTAEGFAINARTPSMFRILPASPLSVVTGIFPANDAALQPEELRTNHEVVFTWEPVQGANEYVFTLWKDGDTPLVTSQPISATRFVYGDFAKLSEGGSFRWQVTAQYRDRTGRIERTGLPGESRFTINVPRPNRGQAYPPGVTYSMGSDGRTER